MKILLSTAIYRTQKKSISNLCMLHPLQKLQDEDVFDQIQIYITNVPCRERKGIG